MKNRKKKNIRIKKLRETMYSKEKFERTIYNVYKCIHYLIKNKK